MAILETLDCEPRADVRCIDVFARRCAGLLEGRGLRWRPVADAYGLDLAGTPELAQRIFTSQQDGFVNDASKLADDPLLPWEVGDLPLRSLGLVGYAAATSPTVADGLAALCRLVQEVCDATHHDVVVDGETASFVLVAMDEHANSVLILRVMLTYLTELIGPEFSPLRLGIAPRDRHLGDALARVAPAPFSADLPFTFVSFPAHLLRRPVAGADHRLADVLRPYWERLAADLRTRPALVRKRLECAVMQTLHDGVPTLDMLAAHLQVSRRRLSAEAAEHGGLRALIDGVRRRLALDMLRRGDLPADRIAGMLGYAEPAAFARAHRRWSDAAATCYSAGTPDPVLA